VSPEGSSVLKSNTSPIGLRSSAPQGDGEGDAEGDGEGVGDGEGDGVGEGAGSLQLPQPQPSWP